MRIIKVAGFCFLILLIAADIASACGVDFDDAYLLRGSKEQFLSIPEGNFWFELKRIAGQKDKSALTEKVRKYNTVGTEVGDLEAFCQKSGLTEKEKQEIVPSYTTVRSQIAAYLTTLPEVTQWDSLYADGFRRHEKFAAPKLNVAFNFPKNMPKEFELYMIGAVAYHNNDFKAAIEKWKELLTLTENERHYRTTWASFMLGKAYLKMRNQKEAIPYFETTRKYAQEGYKDSLDLSHESYGWQALAEHDSGDHVSSIHHYFEQKDANSLSWLCRRVLALDETAFSLVLKDELSRKILIGWGASYFSYYDIKLAEKLLNGIEKTGAPELVDNADRMAWLSYNLGDMEKAKRWLNLSQEKTALAKFVMAKLLMREGEIESAIATLHEALPLFEKTAEKDISRKNSIREINSELGVLKLNRKEYVSALDILLKGIYWEDVAYVAEKVLTSRELEEYLKVHQKDEYLHNKMMWFENQWYGDSNRSDDSDERIGVNASNIKDAKTTTVYEALSYLLSRRFAREGSWNKAVEYMPISFTISGWWENIKRTFNPKEMTKKMADYLENTQNPQLSNREKAENYYKAGRIMRKYGMELTGTELEPDWFVFKGQFAFSGSLNHRFSILLDYERDNTCYDWENFVEKSKKKRSEIEKNRDFFVGSEDEEKRALASLTVPFKRFHYRYKAVDLMRKCADLLPNNDNLKAKALCWAGIYLKNHEPKQADKYYKELVKTCGKTKLGKAADNLRWFPKINEKEE